MGGSVQWMEDMRKVLMLLRTETDFKDDRQQVAAVFNHIFATTLQENGYRNGMDPKRITDTWNSRHMAGRSREWLTVDNPPKNAAEKRYCQQLLKEIDEAVAEIEIRGDDNDEVIDIVPQNVIMPSADEMTAKNTKPKPEDNKQTNALFQSEQKKTSQGQLQESATNQLLLTQPSSTMANSKRKYQVYMSEVTIKGVSSRRRTSAPIQRRTNLNITNMNATDAGRSIAGKTNDNVTSPEPTTIVTSSATDTPLEMIHAIDKEALAKNDTVLTSAAFISHDDPVYQLGGRVYNEIIDGERSDVMVCNRNHCRRCNGNTIDPSLLTTDSSETKGLPFVHLNDAHSNTGEAGFRFIQAHREYNNQYPEHMWKPYVRFSDGVRRKVMMCVGAWCDHCSGPGAQDKKKARYKPGGDLYYLVEKAQAKQSIEKGDD